MKNAAFHVLAALAALSYAWFVSQTSYVTSGLQFVTPLLIVIGIHTGLVIYSFGLRPGFTQTIFARSMGTSIALVLIFFAASLVAPEPAMASGGSDQILGVLFCVAILLALVALAAFIIYLVFKILQFIWRAFRRNDEEDSDNRLYDFGSLGAVVLILAFGSLEGVSGFYTFENHNQVVLTKLIDSSADQVWASTAQATSPDFPLPSILDVFPQPIDVIVDEGIDLGAYRKVQFSGREGAGLLTLQVTERDANEVVLTVIEDTSPYAQWVGFRSLTYRVTQEAGQTRLDVSLGFERKLSPSWFFTPLMKGSAWLAADVLARDIEARAITL